MLVCPQCQLENPNQNKFCQKCGTSLTDKPCPQCGTSVPLSGDDCPNCGTFTGTVWWAMIGEQIAQEQTQIESGDYLDSSRRYRLLVTEENQEFQAIAPSFPLRLLQGKVLDCQPLQKSVLEALLGQFPEVTEQWEEHSDSETETDTSLWHQLGIPELALPYFTLKEFAPMLPEIHDAWLEGSREVILLSDRTHWQPLSQLFTAEPLPNLQIVYLLNQMASLWNALSLVNCRQSLLIESNLRVDEDQSFGLQQLYPDAPDSPPALADLAQLWQRWLNQKKEQSDAVVQLLAQVAEGKIETVTEFRLQLQDLADAQQGTAGNSPTNLSIDISEDNLILLSEPELDDIPLSGPQEPITETNEGDDLSTAVLPMQLLSLSDAGCTDTGCQRHHNEDYFGMGTRIENQHSNLVKQINARGLYIVCDGMGGHAAGEVASAMAVETLQEYFISHWQDELPDTENIAQGIFLANQTLYNVNQQNACSGSGRMGTTLVMALVQDTKVAIAHVGDSRIYRVNRQWGLEQLTVDHEVGQRSIQAGVDPKIAYARPDAYQLTQALGPHDNGYVQPDIRFLDLHEDTLLLLCSDGMSDNNLIEKNWQTYLSHLLSSSHNLDKGLRKLVEFANQKNGHDNITGILVRIKVQPYFRD